MRKELSVFSQEWWDWYRNESPKEMIKALEDIKMALSEREKLFRKYFNKKFKKV